MQNFRVCRLFSTSFWEISKLSKLANDTSKTHIFTFSQTKTDDQLKSDHKKQTNLKELSPGAVLNLATHTIHQFRNLPIQSQFNQQHILNKRLDSIFDYYYQDIVLDIQSRLDFFPVENLKTEESKFQVKYE
jgi:hypothetical protein